MPIKPRRRVVLHVHPRKASRRARARLSGGRQRTKAWPAGYHPSDPTHSASLPAVVLCDRARGGDEELQLYASRADGSTVGSRQRPLDDSQPEHAASSTFSKWWRPLDGAHAKHLSSRGSGPRTYIYIPDGRHKHPSSWGYVGTIGPMGARWGGGGAMYWASVSRCVCYPPGAVVRGSDERGSREPYGCRPSSRLH